MPNPKRPPRLRLQLIFDSLAGISTVFITNASGKIIHSSARPKNNYLI